MSWIFSLPLQDLSYTQLIPVSVPQNKLKASDSFIFNARVEVDGNQKPNYHLTQTNTFGGHMSGSVINTFEIVECNKAMAAAGIDAKLHLRDACGAQSFWFEGEDTAVEAAKVFASEFFAAKGVTF